jgi:uncharacterized protein YfiM (DUF2279 family)
VKVTFLLLVALQGPPADRWFSPDKVKHFFMAAFVQSVSYSVLRATDVGHRSSLIGASAASVAVSIGKEMSDARRTGLFSKRDLVWDAAGIGASTLLLERTTP